MPIPNPLRLFHITPICNLASIAKSKKLYSNSGLLKKKIQHGNIAYQGAQGKRATKIVTRAPAGVIHDYVPFYFAPRSPMLFTINEGNVPDCPHRQQDIIHLVTSVDAVISSGLPYVFYNYNATLDIANCYNNVKHLDEIDWDLFHETPRLDGYCKYWNSVLSNPRYVLRQETRQAEFLIYGSVPLKVIAVVGAYDKTKVDQVREILDGTGVDLEVEDKPDWYFRGQ